MLPVVAANLPCTRPRTNYNQPTTMQHLLFSADQTTPTPTTQSPRLIARPTQNIKQSAVHDTQRDNCCTAQELYNQRACLDNAERAANAKQAQIRLCSRLDVACTVTAGTQMSHNDMHWKQSHSVPEPARGAASCAVLLPQKSAVATGCCGLKLSKRLEQEKWSRMCHSQKCGTLVLCNTEDRRLP